MRDSALPRNVLPMNPSPINSPDASLPAVSPPIMRVQSGTHHDPFEVLGMHLQPGGGTLIRAFMPAAEAVEVAGGRMARVPGTDCFERLLPAGSTVEPHPLLRWQDKGAGNWHTTQCPYSFGPQLGEMDLHLLGEGRHFEAWKVLGARRKTVDGVEGCLFAVWAPAVQRVSVIGDFNDWDGRRHPMRCRGTSGIWNCSSRSGGRPRLQIRNPRPPRPAGVKKTDPMHDRCSCARETTSCVPDDEAYAWETAEWIEARAHFDWQHQPIRSTNCIRFLAAPR